MEEFQREKVYQWALFFLRAPFYKPCEIHGDKSITRFCFDCAGSTFCESCKHSTLNRDHRCIRVLKASREIAVARKDISHMIDTSDIQKYKINDYAIAYLRQRRREERKCQQQKSGKHCAVCGWKLEADSTDEAYIYCSIECKIRGRLKPKEEDVTVKAQEPNSIAMQNNQLMGLLDECVDSRIQQQHDEVVDATVEENSSNPDQNNQLMGQPKEGVVKQNNQSLLSGRKRKRKGKPIRSPFF